MNQNIILTAVKKGYTVNKNNEVLNKKGGKRKLNINNKGYYYFSVRTTKGARSVLVHRLKAYQLFGNKIFKDGLEVRHLDSNPLNNDSSNLKLGTHSDNMMDMNKEYRRINASNPKHNHLEIIKDKTKGMSHSKLMQKYNISSKGTIDYIVNKSMALESYTS